MRIIFMVSCLFLMVIFSCQKTKKEATPVVKDTIVAAAVVKDTADTVSKDTTKSSAAKVVVKKVAVKGPTKKVPIDSTKTAVKK